MNINKNLKIKLANWLKYSILFRNWYSVRHILLFVLKELNFNFICKLFKKIRKINANVFYIYIYIELKITFNDLKIIFFSISKSVCNFKSFIEVYINVFISRYDPEIWKGTTLFRKCYFKALLRFVEWMKCAIRSRSSG